MIVKQYYILHANKDIHIEIQFGKGAYREMDTCC